jgi:hypothetical protein
MSMRLAGSWLSLTRVGGCARSADTGLPPLSSRAGLARVPENASQPDCGTDQAYDVGAHPHVWTVKDGGGVRDPLCVVRGGDGPFRAA